MDLPQDWTDKDYAEARLQLGLPNTASAQEVADAWTAREAAAEKSSEAGK